MDLLLNDNDDMDITNGEVSWVTGVEAIRQHIKCRIKTFLGECVYNQAAGVPWTQVIFRKGTRVDVIKYILEQKIRDTPGVITVYLNPTIDRTTRVVTITGHINTIEGEIDFTDSFEG